MAAVVALLLAAVFLFEGVVISRSRSLPIGSDAMFLALVHLNVIGIGLLAWLLARNVVKLVIDRRQGLIGAKLTTKFVISFVFTAALSTTGLFILSAFLVAHTIETWFESEIDRGLGQALEIADEYFAAPEARVRSAARSLAREISEEDLFQQDAETVRRWVADKRSEYGLGAVEIFDASRAELASAVDVGQELAILESAESSLIEAGLAGEARSDRVVVQGGDVLRSATSVHAGSGAVIGVVVVQASLPGAIGSRAEQVGAALESYRRLQPSRGPFEGSMLLLLGMLTLVSVLFSTWMGFRLSRQIIDPIQRLAGATSELAAGHLDVRVEQRGEDELGLLVAGFNRMARDLEASRDDLERRRALMEVVLGGVGAGVISIGADGSVTTINPSAVRLLGVPPGEWVGRKPDEVLYGDALAALERLLERLSHAPGDLLRSQGTVAVGQDHRILHWTVSRLRDRDGRPAGAVVLIDDVTQIVRAQRTAAWRDVARRMAHEIKNPLTPIQLSAQRLLRKLDPRLDDPEARGVLKQCSDAITSQVEAMKHLLAEFSSFADLPATEPVPTDLNELVSEAVAMYEGTPSIEFITDLAPGLPALDLDREQIKRVILNLIDNAICAVEAVDDGVREIRVSTRAERALGSVQLEVADTGCGIQPADRVKLFQPGFSRKQNGTGIGLSIVSRIVSDHSGSIRVRTHAPRGTRFIVELPLRLG